MSSPYIVITFDPDNGRPDDSFIFYLNEVLHAMNEKWHDIEILSRKTKSNIESIKVEYNITKFSTVTVTLSSDGGIAIEASDEDVVELINWLREYVPVEYRLYIFTTFINPLVIDAYETLTVDKIIVYSNDSLIQ